MTRIVAVPDLAKAAGQESDYDAVLLVGHDLAHVELPPAQSVLAEAARLDARLAKTPSLWLAPGCAGGRLVTAPTGPLHRDVDDVRRYAEAAAAGIRIARDAGARSVLLVVQAPPREARYEQAAQVAAIGALGALWEPLEAREALGEAKAEPVRRLGVAALGGEPFGKEHVAHVEAVDAGLRLARDLAGTDPERMAPQRFAEYVQKALRGLPVEVTVARGQGLARDYPLLSAVARCSQAVARHRPCVVRLVYTGKGKPARTLLFAGKGVTYDTGGADLKTGGGMAGMSRDKGGAAAIAGLFLTAAKLRVPGVRLVAELGLVRNSIGADAFVSDEIVASHAGVRVRIGNTDAEGRLVLADLLSHLRVRALREKDPHLLSVATLTGHAGRAVGTYSIALDNGPARARDVAGTLAALGDQWGDPFEVSRLRREDYEFVRPRSSADDVLSANTLPSSATPRGHQFPMAFLAIASGLVAHGTDGDPPLPFTHVDIGGSGCEGGDWQHGRPTGRPLLAMLQALLRR